MGKHGAQRRQSLLHRPRREARKVRIKQPHKIDGPVPDIWDTPDVKLPGNPHNSDHEPMDVLMLNVKGQRVCVFRKKLTIFRNTGTEPVEAWLWRPQEALELWSNPRHHALTHALRLLQLCSCTFEGHDRRSEERLIRGEINPQTLIGLCGASPSLAGILVTLLVEHGLLKSENGEAGTPLRWFINMRIKGFSPGMQLLDSRDISEGILPEFVSPGKSGEPETSPTEGEEMGATEIETVSQPALWDSYELLAQQAEGGNPENGYVVFKTDGAPEELFVDRLGISKSTARGFLNRLRDLKVYESSRGPKPERKLRIDEASKQKVKEAAEPRGAGSPGDTPPPAEPSHLPPGAVEVTDPAELQGLFVQLSATLDAYLERAETAEQELEEERRAHDVTRTELKKLQERPQATFVLPVELARHLDAQHQSD